MYFAIYGPFKMVKEGRLIGHTNESKRKFWTNVDNSIENLAAACGCYLFAIRAAKGMKPWYVGKAERQSFKKEVLSPHKLQIYNGIVGNQQKGTPILFLIAKKSKKRSRFSKPTTRVAGNRFISELEKMLIGVALERNPRLQNIRDSKILRRMVVPGFINSHRGGSNKSTRAFAKAIY